LLFRFSYYSDRGQCAKCYLSCKTCSGPRRDQCVTCPRGWQLAAGECHPECPEGFFKSNFGCQKCHHYCRTCKGELQSISCCRIKFIFLISTGNYSFTHRRRSTRMHFMSTSLDVGRWIMYGMLRSTILRFFDSALQELSF